MVKEKKEKHKKKDRVKNFFGYAKNSFYFERNTTAMRL